MRALVVGLGRRGGDIAAKLPPSASRDVVYVDDDEELTRRPVGARFPLAAPGQTGERRAHDPESAFREVMADRERVAALLSTADLVTVVAGLGGGAGAGGARAFLSVAAQLGLSAAAVVMRPFGVEGEKRNRRAARSLGQLRELGAPVVELPQDQLLLFAGRTTRMGDLLAMADDAAVSAVEDIALLLAETGRSGFDAWAALSSQALYGKGVAAEGSSLGDAVRAALGGPFLGGAPLSRASGLALVLRARRPLEPGEVSSAVSVAVCASNGEARLLLARTVEPSLETPLHVGLFHVGPFGESRSPAVGFWVPGPSG